MLGFLLHVHPVNLLFTQGAKFDGCSFERLDGNGVMVSGYNRNATITNSDFAFLGGNAIAAWGYTNETATDPGRPGIALANFPAAGVDGTDGEHPRYTTVTGCTAREVGLYEKQSSFFVQAKTAQSTIIGNVFFVRNSLQWIDRWAPLPPSCCSPLCDPRIPTLPYAPPPQRGCSPSHPP